MKMNQQQFEQHARQMLDDSVEHLDAATLSRLNQVRQQALESKSGFFLNLPVWSALATTAAVVLLVVMLTPQQSDMSPGLTSSTDLEILAMADSEVLEFYEELEFYEWLDYVEQTG